MSEILCIVDGMQDKYFDVNKYTSLASFPQRSSINTVKNGLPVETLHCTLSLLEVQEYNKNIRAWIEMLGAGLCMSDEDIVYKGNWLSLTDSGIIQTFAQAPDISYSTQYVEYIPMGESKFLLLLKGQIKSFVEQKHTVLDYLGCDIGSFKAPEIPALKQALQYLNNVERNKAVILWSSSIKSTLAQYPKKAAAVCSSIVVKGIAKSMGMQLISTNNMTGDIDTDLEEKLDKTLNAAKKYPFVLLHIAGCDAASHRKNLQEKQQFLNRIDKIVFSSLIKTNHSIKVVSDHGSDPDSGKHISGAQPCFIRP